MKEGQNENPFEMPHLDRAVGLPKEYRHRQEEFEEHLTDEQLRLGKLPIEGYEVEKTDKEIKIINYADRAVAFYMKEYGRKKDIVLPLENIHILKEGGTEEWTHAEKFGGAHNGTIQTIIIDRTASGAEFAVHCFHELFHAKDYSALQVVVDEAGTRSLKEYRAGINIMTRDGKTTYFKDFNEAIIGYFTQRFVHEFVEKDDFFKEDLEAIGGKIRVSREEELEKLNTIVDQLLALNTDKFKSRDEIMDLFIRADINGDLLPVARLVESSLGKGSFRKMGAGSMYDEPQSTTA